MRKFIVLLSICMPFVAWSGEAQKWAGKYLLQSTAQDGWLVLTHDQGDRYRFEVEAVSKRPSHPFGHVQGIIRIAHGNALYHTDNGDAEGGEHCTLHFSFHGTLVHIKQQEDCLVGVNATLTGDYKKP